MDEESEIRRGRGKEKTATDCRPDGAVVVEGDDDDGVGGGRIVRSGGDHPRHWLARKDRASEALSGEESATGPKAYRVLFFFFLFLLFHFLVEAAVVLLLFNSLGFVVPGISR